MSSHHHSAGHQFKGTWRWPKPFENWVKDTIEETNGSVANICAGLSPIGDVRIDLNTPTELITNLQNDSGTNLERAREYLQDHIPGTPPVDVVASLYNADDPCSHPAADYIQIDTIRADVFSENGLPLSNDSFEWVIADPPWLNIPREDRSRLFSELTRITKPGGHIIFNAFWIPTGDQPATLDKLVPRQDTDRWSVGTPKVSWVGIYTVHKSIHTARHLSRTLPSREFEPEPSTLEEAIRAETEFELLHRHGLNKEDYDLNIVDPTTERFHCPQCGCTNLDPVHGSILPAAETTNLYECRDCAFRALKSELTHSYNNEATLSSPTGNPIHG